jgi:hypothetical protein
MLRRRVAASQKSLCMIQAQRRSGSKLAHPTAGSSRFFHAAAPLVSRYRKK